MAFCRITSNDSDTTIFQTREQAGYSPQLVTHPYAYIEALPQMMSDGTSDISADKKGCVQRTTFVINFGGKQAQL